MSLPVSSADRPQSAVFISYAHENDPLREQVKALADWLGECGCTVLTDHQYRYRPPAEGWQAWMLHCIDQAATVLVVCTPKLKLRYEKDEAPDTGHGAVYEGAIVTQHIYDNAMRNTKFFPILPDGGSYEDIPTALRSWWNGHNFPSGREGILRMISAEAIAPEVGLREDVEPSPPSHHHHRLVLRLLKAVEATPFFQALGDELAERLNLDTAPRTPEQTVRQFAECPRDEEHVLELFYSVRCALDRVPPATFPKPLRKSYEEAAAALYCLAACCMVYRAAEAAGVSYVVDVPSNEPIICGVVATALFGGELHLVSAEQGDLPTAKYVFEVKVPDGGDQPVADFERAAFVALFKNDHETPHISTYDGPLKKQHCDKLAARLRTIKRRHRASLAFIVRSAFVDDACRGFGNGYQVPVMVPASEATTELLGMDVGTLLEEIREFWAELKVTREPSSAAPEKPSQTPERASAMPAPGHQIHVYGEHAAIHIDHRQGADLEALIPLLRDLAQEIAALPSAEQRKTLAAHVETARHEAEHADKADPDRIKRVLDIIKSGAEGLEHGSKIIMLCNKAYNVTAPLLGLPPSPLP